MAQTESSVMIETLNFTQNCKHGKSPDCCTDSIAYFRITVAKKKESLQFIGNGNKDAISI
jgi:NADPH-dependent 7-cyano-7-deazaguanine reductase QueF